MSTCYAGERYDMTIRFNITTWVCYCGHMYGRPSIASRACEKVLQYLLDNPQLVVTSWRKRVYLYASATIAEDVGRVLKDWLQEGDERLQKFRRSALVKLNPKGCPQLFPFLGSCIVNFIGRKHYSFPNGVESVSNFKNIAPWKRAMIYVRLTRTLTKLHANKHWNNFGYDNYKWNRKMFAKYLTLDQKIIECSPAFKNLPQKPATVLTVTPTKRKRPTKKTSSTYELSSPGAQPAPVKSICLLSSSSDDDDEEESQRPNKFDA